MAKRFLPYLLFIFLYACGSNGNSEQEVVKMLSGEEAFKKHCVLCHGTDGKKGFAGAGDLTKSVLNHDEIIKIITHGKNENPGKIMTPFGSVLSKDEIERVAIYVESIRE